MVCCVVVVVVVVVGTITQACIYDMLHFEGCKMIDFRQKRIFSYFCSNIDFGYTFESPR